MKVPNERVSAEGVNGCRIKISSIVLSSFNSCLHSFTEREMKWMKRQWMNGVWKSCELMSCEWTKATKHECRRQKARRSEPFNAIHSICFNWWMHERRAKGAASTFHEIQWNERQARCYNCIFITCIPFHEVHSMK